MTLKNTKNIKLLKYYSIITYSINIYTFYILMYVIL